MKKSYFFLILPLLLTIVAMCSQHFDTYKTTNTVHTSTYEEPFLVVVENDSVHFNWNAPEDEPLIDNFILSYHTQTSSEWIPIDTLPFAIKNRAIVHRNQLSLSDSVFFFGVQSVGEGIESSEVHSSDESNAAPSGGWVLFWRK